MVSRLRNLSIRWKLTVVITAWGDSYAGAAFRIVAAGVRERGVVGQTRLAGEVTAVASVTALAMQQLAPRPAPLTWIVPALFLVFALCAILVSWDRPAR